MVSACLNMFWGSSSSSIVQEHLFPLPRGQDATPHSFEFTKRKSQANQSFLYRIEIFPSPSPLPLCLHTQQIAPLRRTCTCAALAAWISSPARLPRRRATNNSSSSTRTAAILTSTPPPPVVWQATPAAALPDSVPPLRHNRRPPPCRHLILLPLTLTIDPRP